MAELPAGKNLGAHSGTNKGHNRDLPKKGEAHTKRNSQTESKQVCKLKETKTPSGIFHGGNHMLMCQVGESCPMHNGLLQPHQSPGGGTPSQVLSRGQGAECPSESLSKAHAIMGRAQQVSKVPLLASVLCLP